MGDTVTCPGCRHVVAVGDAGKGRCGNCGLAVTRAALAPPPLPPRVAAPEAKPAPSPPTPPVGSAATASTATPGTPIAPPSNIPHTRPAGIVAFICSMLFFIPFVTQAVGLIAALIALARPRQENEKRGLAWLALVLALFFGSGWGLATYAFLRTRATAMAPRVGLQPWSGRPVGPNETPEWQVAGEYQRAMENIHAAASGYYRDFKRWPATVEAMAGDRLPTDYELPEGLTWHPVPQGERRNLSFILVESEPVKQDPDGEWFDQPHRLVLRLSGRIDYLPAESSD